MRKMNKKLITKLLFMTGALGIIVIPTVATLTSCSSSSTEDKDNNDKTSITKITVAYDATKVNSDGTTGAYVLPSDVTMDDINQPRLQLVVNANETSVLDIGTELLNCDKVKEIIIDNTPVTGINGFLPKHLEKLTITNNSNLTMLLSAYGTPNEFKNNLHDGYPSVLIIDYNISISYKIADNDNLSTISLGSCDDTESRIHSTSTTVDILNNKKLSFLTIEYARLDNLNLTNEKSLEKLALGASIIGNLDVSGITELKELRLVYFSVVNNLDASNSGLTTMLITNPEWTPQVTTDTIRIVNLNLSNTHLTKLNVENLDPRLKTLNINNCNDLTSVPGLDKKWDGNGLNINDNNGKIDHSKIKDKSVHWL